MIIIIIGFVMLLTGTLMCILKKSIEDWYQGIYYILNIISILVLVPALLTILGCHADVKGSLFYYNQKIIYYEMQMNNHQMISKERIDFINELRDWNEKINNINRFKDNPFIGIFYESYLKDYPTFDITKVPYPVQYINIEKEK